MLSVATNARTTSQSQKGGLLLSKSNEKDNSLISINNSGIYYQELRKADRAMSPRVRIGRLVIVDGDVLPEYDAMAEYDALLSERNSLEKEVQVAFDLLKNTSPLDDAVEFRKANLKRLSEWLVFVHEQVENNPIHHLSSLNSKSLSAVDKLVNNARSRHQWNPTKTDIDFSGFSNYPTDEFFLEQAGRELMKRHNESLESRGIETGYLTLSDSIAIARHRFSKSAEVRKKRTGK